MRYSDRQFAALPIGLAVFIAIGNAVAIGAIYGATVRLVTGAIGLAVVAVMALRTVQRVSIGDGEVRVGRAHLHADRIARAEVLTGESFRRALRTEAHPTDYLRIRSAAAGVRLFLDDATDPHRAWVISVREPGRALVALQALGVSTVAANAA